MRDEGSCKPCYNPPVGSLTREDREDIEAHMAVMNDPDTEWISLQELHDEIRSDRAFHNVTGSG